MSQSLKNERRSFFDLFNGGLLLIVGIYFGNSGSGPDLQIFLDTVTRVLRVGGVILGWYLLQPSTTKKMPLYTQQWWWILANSMMLLVIVLSTSAASIFVGTALLVVLCYIFPTIKQKTPS